MVFRSAYVPCLLAILAAACGGSVFGQKDDTGASGSASGGNTGHAGSTGSAGKPSTAGSSASGGSTSTGGSASAGGSVGTAGMMGVAGSVGVGGFMDCGFIECAEPICADGATPITPPGQCCPTCPAPQACSGVMCTPVMACPMGYTLGQPPGACCQGCVPNPGGVACPKIACGDTTCPLGYVRGDLVGGCCTECVPDPLFCNADSDCVVADRPRPCCGCPEAISSRQYAADPCWSALDMPRMTPQSCQPQVVCNIACVECPTPGPATCRAHRCSDLSVGAK
ncbi:MAG TPA: hypothetical protein VNG33_10930 [Polyangiaceae bacterium]|nr:hypothetical protein [Polyangiaceae bacterium]